MGRKESSQTNKQIMHAFKSSASFISSLLKSEDSLVWIF